MIPVFAGALLSVSVPAADLQIDAGTVIRKNGHRRLVGSNIALWNQPWELGDAELHNYVRELAPAYVRIPGGSWANHYVWNGNGVNLGDGPFDESRLKNGVWEIDWSGYAPGFNVEGPEHRLASDNYHGIWHVRQLHDFVEDFGASGMVTVNLGSGTPEMAAEWVRWANIKNDYNIRYWEIGNELEGSWELGHLLPDGTPVSGEVIARRFKAFAEAMKAVDPEIKTGGPASSNDRGAFIPEILRDAGDLVDFVSFHSYPVKNRHKTEAAFYGAVGSLEPAMERIRGWIEEYQPERRGGIEIAVTEWNSQVREDRTTADLMNGLWSAMWIGEMFRTGVDFANQWDLVTSTETGGHGLFYFDRFDFEQPGVPQDIMDFRFETFNPVCIPKGSYWALWLWSRWMGDELVRSNLSGGPNLYASVTRSDTGLQVLLVNRSRETAEPVRLHSSVALSGEAAVVQLSHREYFWNPITRRPQWSRRPEAVRMELGDQIVVPPFSALVLQIPFKGKPLAIRKRADEVIRAPRVYLSEPTCELLLPEATPEDVPVEAWVLAPGVPPCSANREARFADLRVSGPAVLSRDRVRISEGVGRFLITPTGTGTVTVTAGGAEAKMQCTAVEERTEICWAFEAPSGGIRSDFSFSLSDTAKPNQQTASIRFDGKVPSHGKDVLLEFNPIPDGIESDRVDGFVCEMRAAHDLVAVDPGARIQVVLQSHSNHWIPIGSVALNELGTDWRTFEFRVRDHETRTLMHGLYAVRLVLSSERPVQGGIDLDDAGFISR